MKARNVISVVAVIALAFSAEASTRADISSAIAKVMPFMSALCKTFADAAGALASLMFLWAAIQWIMSRDDPGKRKKAQDMMIAVIVGVIIIGVSIYIVNSILESMGLAKPDDDFCNVF